MTPPQPQPPTALPTPTPTPIPTQSSPPNLTDNPHPPNQTRPHRYAIHITLFLLTVLSCMIAGNPEVLFGDTPITISELTKGWTFAVPLLTILLAHEFGHFIAARIHKVPASLPYFIPMPISPIGTMGAVILMRKRIDSRNALLDIGAAGPLAGLAASIPILIWGLLHSEVNEITGHGILEGQCILYSIIKYATIGPIPNGSDVFLHPTAFAGWVGLLITMINLVPVAQLDGGHVAYALLDSRQNTVAKYVHFGLLAVFATLFTYQLITTLAKESLAEAVMRAIEMSVFWLAWFGFLFLLKFLSGKNHPPVEPGQLSRTRKIIAVACLLLFILLFMPTPWSQY